MNPNMKRCTNLDCGTLHSHPTRELCSKCSGWSCPDCGRPKTPEQRCAYIECVARRKKLERKAKKDEQKRSRRSTLLPYRRHEP